MAALRYGRYVRRAAAAELDFCLLVNGYCGRPAVQCFFALVGFVGLITYKLIKRTTARPRPASLDTTIRLGTDPLDHYSFPSGHTLHAVGFSVVALHSYPGLAWWLVPFASLVAASSVILGLHYPTDVLAGAAIGAVIASGCLSLL